MLHLQNLLHPIRRAASPIHLLLHRALLSASTAPSSGQLAIEDYLVASCGLTPEQAAKATTCISRRRFSPSNADAVLAFLVGPELAFSPADFAHLVSNEPRLLNYSEETLRARLDSFRSHGFFAAQIRSLVRASPRVLRVVNLDEKLGFWMPFIGSAEKLLIVVKRNGYLFTSDLERVKTNIKLLQEGGLGAHDIAKMLAFNSRMLTSHPDSVRAILMRANKLGVPQDSPMFKEAVAVAAALSLETIATKLKFLGDVLGLSDAEVARVAKTSPMILRRSCKTLQRHWEFLTKVVGLDTGYILDRASMLMYSLERRLVPRHYVMRKLLEKGLIPKDCSFFLMVRAGHKSFNSRYILPYKVILPGLANEYASACEGKIPT
ncbi:hypothetical protein ACP4OV_000296 [Aristida adscensionis]